MIGSMIKKQSYWEDTRAECGNHPYAGDNKKKTCKNLLNACCLFEPEK